ncbi:DUF2339 domain-containing protein, partial [Burkholderia sp. Tr-20355]|nr:DUF2339 domain-containing protein [Burkholderia sp. Tr-20355]
MPVRLPAVLKPPRSGAIRERRTITIARGSKALNWAFAVIGFVVGGIAALIGDFSAASGALLGAAAGFAIGRALQQRHPRNTPAARDAFALSATSPSAPLPLADRVARLEATVDTLTRELDSLRAQLAGAKAGAATAGNVAQTVPAGAATAPPSTPVPPPPVQPAQP